MDHRNFSFVFIITIFLIISGCVTNSSFVKTSEKNDSLTVTNINERDSNGSTPLMKSIWSKKTNVAKQLIESGADVKIRDNSGYDALRYAIDYKQLDLINLLLDKGADIESKDSSGRTPLAIAISYVSSSNTVKKIFSKATNASEKDDAFEIVKLLIKRGANVNAKDNMSETVLDLALTIQNRMDVAVELVNAGASLMIPTEGKARLLFIGDEFFGFGKNEAWIYVGDVTKYLAADIRFACIDVNPGKQTVEIAVSWYQKKVNTEIDLKAGQTYYFMVAQNTDNKAAQIVGGIVGEKIVEAASGKGPFFLTQIEESVAKEKIKVLLKSK